MMKESIPENVLIQQAQNGDVQAFETLVRQHEQSVLSLAFSIMGNLSDAKDVYQDAFIQVYRYLHTFRFESQFQTWLYKIVMHCALNMKRKGKRFLSVAFINQETNEDFWQQLPEQDACLPDQNVLNKEVWQVIETNLDKLSMMERVVFVLRYQQEFKLKEIAEITESSLGTVKNYLFRGTQKMKQCLKPYMKAEL